jgi:hypothetical protein
MMRAIEFKTKIMDNRILIPRRKQSELFIDRGKSVRVVIFVEDSSADDDQAYRQMVKNRFLEGYAASDSVYDI